MNNKEAIEILKNYHNGYFGYKIDDVREAHNLAIKALEFIDYYHPIWGVSYLHQDSITESDTQL